MGPYFVMNVTVIIPVCVGLIICGRMYIHVFLEVLCDLYVVSMYIHVCTCIYILVCVCAYNYYVCV